MFPTIWGPQSLRQYQTACQARLKHLLLMLVHLLLILRRMLDSQFASCVLEYAQPGAIASGDCDLAPRNCLEILQHKTPASYSFTWVHEQLGSHQHLCPANTPKRETQCRATLRNLPFESFLCLFQEPPVCWLPSTAGPGLACKLELPGHFPAVISLYTGAALPPHGLLREAAVGDFVLARRMLHMDTSGRRA